MPVNVTSAPASVRPRVNAFASAALSNGSRWMRTVVFMGGNLLRRRGGGYPPVMGGKKAISVAFPIAACGLTWARSMAARITFGFSKA